MDPMETTIASYNSTAEEYAIKTANLHPKQAAEEFLSYLPKNGKILDLGCGTGRDAKIFTENGYKVFGIDPSSEMIKIARETAPDAYFSSADARNLSFREEVFDGIWACASLIHLPKKDLPKALDGAYNVLKQDGIFYLDFKQGIGEGLTEDSRYGGVEKFVSYHQKSDIEKMLEDSGFENLKAWGKEINNSYATNTWMMFLAKKN
jgi:ubiquinone/menaquinone biosynthesis C-methylase UbiE